MIRTLLLALVAVVSPAHAEYVFTDFDSWRPGSINNAGEFVASTVHKDQQLYSHGQVIDLPSAETAILNDRGDVVLSPTGSGPLVYRNGQLLPLLLVGSNATVFGLNNHGHAVGWDHIGSFIHYGDRVEYLPDGYFASKINDAGQVFGNYDPPGTQSARERRAFVYSDGHFQELGWMGPNWVQDANEAGEFAAGSFIYTAGKLTESNGYAFGINNHGDVVGSGLGFAFISSEGVLTDLNELVMLPPGVQLTNAFNINDVGQITGQYLTDDGDQGGFLLTPVAAVPEPSALVCLLLCIGALVLRDSCRSSRQRDHPAQTADRATGSTLVAARESLRLRFRGIRCRRPG